MIATVRAAARPHFDQTHVIGWPRLHHIASSPCLGLGVVAEVTAFGFVTFHSGAMLFVACARPAASRTCPAKLPTALQPVSWLRLHSETAIACQPASTRETIDFHHG